MMTGPSCVICKVGELRPGVTSITLSRGESVVVVTDVPAHVCDTCGHAYFDSGAATALERIHEETLAAGSKYAVREFVAKVA